jgi:putative tryptophan/tyrosine transport system substrate-binding protein
VSHGNASTICCASQLLKEIAPDIARVGVIFNPDASPQSKFYLQSIEAAAGPLGVQTMAMPLRSAAEIESTIELFARQSNGGLIFPPGTFARLREQLFTEAASRYRLPSMGEASRNVRFRG